MSNKNNKRLVSIESLVRALSEPISEVDNMSTKEVRSYLASHGIGREHLRSVLESRIQAVKEQLPIGESHADVFARFKRVRPSLASVVGDSKTILTKNFTGFLSASPQRASQMVSQLENADETAMKELYEELKQWGEQNSSD